MPGKQMAIEADLNAGLINEAEATRRRENIRKEADFYGAMDGAGKFVQGDVTAGLLITFINLIGGILIGMIQKGMDWNTALTTFSLLTIGDGLVATIPSIIVSTSAGLIVSRAASEAKMGEEYLAQLTYNSRVLKLASAVLMVFAMVPGLPGVPFLVFSGVMLLASRSVADRDAQADEDAQGKSGAKAALREGAETPEEVQNLLPLDVLELEVGYGLIPLVDEEQNGNLLTRIRSIRRQFALESGFIVPPMHVRDNLQLRPGEYAIIIRGNEVARAEMLVGHQLAMNPGDAKKTIAGHPTVEPAFGLPATWIPEERKDEAQHAGWTVVDLATVIATHLTEVIRLHAAELMSRQDVQKLIEGVAATDAKVVEELVPELMTLGQVHKVLQNLLRERVSIRDMPSILEVLADHAHLTKDVDLLTEFVRQRLARTILRQYLTAQGELPLMTIGADIEEALGKAVNETDRGAYLTMDPNTGQRILNALNQGLTELTGQNFQPLVLCTPLIRRHLRKLTERFIPNLVVLSHSELTSSVQLKIIGDITFAYAA